MEKRKFNTLLRRARRAENELNTHCSVLAELLQPYFNEEIYVFNNPTDGIVVLHGFNSNTPIEDVFKEIENDPNSYL